MVEADCAEVVDGAVVEGVVSDVLLQPERKDNETNKRTKQRLNARLTVFVNFI